MSIVTFFGFDDLAASQMTADGWSGNPASVVAGLVDGNAWRFNNTGNASSIVALPAAYGSLIVGFLLRRSMNDTTNTFLRLLNGTGTRVCDLQLISGKIRVLNAAGSTIVTDATTLTPNTWTYIEVKIVVGTSGTVQVKINGATEISTATGNFGTSNIDHLSIRNDTSNSTTALQQDFDDLYVIDPSVGTDNDFLCTPTITPHITTVYPNADGAHSQWTPNSGSTHYTRVDENAPGPDGDTSYVSDNTVGDRDSYAFGDLSGTVNDIIAVKARAYARGDVAGRSIGLVARPGSTDHDGASQAITTSYAMYSEIWETNPDTGVAWAESEVNAAEFGIKVTA